MEVQCACARRAASCTYVLRWARPVWPQDPQGLIANELMQVWTDFSFLISKISSWIVSISFAIVLISVLTVLRTFSIAEISSSIDLKLLLIVSIRFPIVLIGFFFCLEQICMCFDDYSIVLIWLSVCRSGNHFLIRFAIVVKSVSIVLIGSLIVLMGSLFVLCRFSTVWINCSIVWISLSIALLSFQLFWWAL